MLPKKEKTYKYLSSPSIKQFYHKDVITTPFNLIEEILDKLPKELFTNKDSRFLDPCCGRGAFLLAIKFRLLEQGHSERHIVENMLFGVDIYKENTQFSSSVLGLNKYKVNMVTGDSLGKELFGGMKFDCVVGNPPYTEQGNVAVNLFNKFVEKAFEISTQHITLIIPRAWFRSDSRANKQVREKVLKPSLKVLKVLGDDMFGAIVKTCYFITDKQKEEKGFSFISQAGEENIVEYPNYIFDDIVVSNICAKVLEGNTGAYKFNSTNKKAKQVSEEQDCVAFVNSKGVELKKGFYTTPNQDKWRLITGYMKNSYYHVDSVQLIAPNIASSDKCYTQMEVDEVSGRALVSILHSKLAKFLFDKTRTSRTFDNSQLKFLPFLTDKVYTDPELYKHFGLIQEEVNLIESTIK